MSEKIAIIGLGYVGLPVAMAMARHFDPVVGFDLKSSRIQDLKKGHDETGEVSADDLAQSRLILSDQEKDLTGCNFFVVTVPTPIDAHQKPDLTPLQSACEIVGRYLQKGAVVVFESTVYPGVTEEVCGPLLAKASGLKQGKDFKLGYSPERINPGDQTHRLENIVKVVSGEDAATLDRVSAVYEKIIVAGLHRASSIKVAEAAKVIENTQRDLNIALMNELSLIFDRLNIPTKDVLAAAGTKWNFLPFYPGLVGGHCIGVDPYYLTFKAEEIGYHPQVILAGRRINDSMGAHVARKTIKLMKAAGKALTGGKVAVFGITFKENVPDLRNSRVVDLVRELQEYGVDVVAHDPVANKKAAREEYGIDLVDDHELVNLDAVIFAVPHQQYLNGFWDQIARNLKHDHVLVDVKSVMDRTKYNCVYWSL